MARGVLLTVFIQPGDWAAVYDLTMSRVMCMAYMVGVIYGVSTVFTLCPGMGS